jgi:uncharacterized protein YndB with AHSA1/START domain
MNSAPTLKVTLPSDREIAMTRVFAAPRELVFEAWTRPEYLRRWLGVHHGFEMVVCEIDLRVGGTFRYVWRGPGGMEMGMRGVYHEIVRPARIVSSEKFDESWYEGDALGTLTFVEEAGRTTVEMRVLYDSKDVRDAVLRSPMESGVAAGFDKLAELLEGLRTPSAGA